MAGLVERNQIGKREDLSDIISVVDARKTPLTSMVKKGGAPGNTLQEWQADAYDDPNTDGVVDGADVETFENAAENREMLYGRIQKSRRSPMVSDMAENVSNVAGLGRKEYAAAVAKKTIELKRDIEAVCCSDNESQADNGTAGYKIRGIGKWIQNGAQTDLPVPAAFRTPAGSIDTTAINSLTEDTVSELMRSMFEECGENNEYVGLFGSELKRRFSEFALYAEAQHSSNTAINRFNHQGDAKMVCNTVDIYKGDFGTIEIVLTTFNAQGTTNAPTRRGYVLDMSKWSMGFTRMPGHRKLEDRGGGPRGIVDAVYTLRCHNPLGQGKFAATTT